MQGPYAIANTFLGNIHPSEQTHLHQKLKVCFKEFCKLCQDALIKNKTLISEEQYEYQREMEKNFQEFVKSMEPMLKHRKKHHSNPRRHRYEALCTFDYATSAQSFTGSILECAKFLNPGVYNVSLVVSWGVQCFTCSILGCTMFHL